MFLFFVSGTHNGFVHNSVVCAFLSVFLLFYWFVTIVFESFWIGGGGGGSYHVSVSDPDISLSSSSLSPSSLSSFSLSSCF